MSERPNEDPGAGPAPEGGGAGGGGSQDAPWWHEPGAGAGTWWGHGTPGGTEREQGGWWSGAGAPPAGGGAPPTGQWPPPGQTWQPGWGPGGHWQPGPGYAGTWGHHWAPPPGVLEARARRRRVVRSAGAAVLTLLALMIGIGIGYGAFGAGTAPSSNRSTSGATAGRTAPSTRTTTTSTGKSSSASGAPHTLAAIAAKVDPGLVDINTVLGYQTEEAAGTGMVLTPTGRVLTNNHVIEGSTHISVTDLGNGKTYTASVLGYSKTQDVAVIQLKGASGLQTVKTGNSSTVKVGQAIVGIGNAGGVGGTPSVAGGSVTALGQAITASDSGPMGTTTEHLSGLIQTDANIEPGDSGGPLVNTVGEVVGMDTAASAAQGFSFRGATTGQGYSIPINTALSIAKQITDGKQTRTVHVGGTPFLGVYVESAATAHRGGTPFTRFGSGLGATATTTTSGHAATPASGALVEGVIPGTPAAHSGLVKGDVITGLAGTTVRTANDITSAMLQYHPGDSVKVTWTTTSGQTQTGTLTLSSGPAD